jgi:hypothetical protein
MDSELASSSGGEEKRRSLNCSLQLALAEIELRYKNRRSQAQKHAISVN